MSGQDGEEFQGNVILLHFNRQEGCSRRIQVKHPPVAGHIWIGEQLIQEQPRPGIGASQEVAMQPLDENGSRDLPVDNTWVLWNFHWNPDKYGINDEISIADYPGPARELTEQTYSQNEPQNQVAEPKPGKE